MEAWKTLEFLGGLLDGEGYFYISIIYRPEVGMWYPIHSVSTDPLVTPEWKRIVDYWREVYGGSTSQRGKYYYWRIRQRKGY